jgi:predicted Fe-Mo cluster-binding NifX family protein
VTRFAAAASSDIERGKKMRIAITSTGPSLDSDLDPRFGRAQHILIVDQDGALIEAVDNSQRVNALSGAGIQTGKLLADKKVDVLLTGNCGPNAFKALQAAGIKVAVEQCGTVKEALERFNKGEATFASEPNVEPHW